MSAPDFTGSVWRKSSWSGDNGGQCVEVAVVDDLVGVRDSKVAGGPVVAVAGAAWGAFVRAVAAGA